MNPLTTKIIHITVACMMINEVDPEKINGPDVILEAMKDEKMTAKYLVRRLKRELNAKEVKVFEDEDEEGNTVTVRTKKILWNIRQRARMDAHKLRGDYPSEKHDLKVTGDLTVIVKKYDWEDEDGSPAST